MRTNFASHRAATAFLVLLPLALLSQEVYRDPGPIEALDLAGGPGGAANSPQGPFSFIEAESRGINPKLVVTDGQGRKWMVKFGEEAKAEVFASRIAWAAGYPVRTSYYVQQGTIQGAPAEGVASKVLAADGSFRHGARFQLFDHSRFREVDGGKLDLRSKDFSQRELNGLKLTALLLGNWDLKPANTAVFEIDGKRYATISDWGASLGDPGAAARGDRKWNCEKFSKDTEHLIDGVADGYLSVNYEQYAGMHIDKLTSGIRAEDLKWFTDRISKLSDSQIRAALHASGATPDEQACFTAALRERIDKFTAAANGGQSTTVTRTRTVTTTTTTTK
jgi:hypothetical protein